jgi:serine O-acetyltransferase
MENNLKNQEAYRDAIDALCHPESYQKVMHRSSHDVPMPSTKRLGEVVEMVRSVIFPGYFGNSYVKLSNMKYYLGYTLDKLDYILTKQIRRGFCFDCPYQEDTCIDCQKRAHDLSIEFINSIPKIRYILSTDVQAAYEGDPAAKNPGETIFSYPSIWTLTNFRIANQLHSMGVPLIPRIITEMAHSETGVDIHPGATIGEKFFMDHCTGIVIGETTIIGDNVRIYQGVTLGAKSFPLDKDGNPIKGIARHPIVEDDVIIYSGATILGRVTIGKGSVIGGNIWITKDVAPNSKILQGKPRCSEFSNGGGI